MKRLSLLALLSLLVISCSATPPPITFTQEVMEYKNNQSEIQITYPKAVSSNQKVADSINKVILANIISHDEVGDALSPFEGLIESAKLCEADSLPFSYNVSWSGFENAKLISFNTTHEIYAGGAHGSIHSQSLLFDKVTGRQIKILDHVTDTVALRRLIIAECISQNGLDATKSADEQGYFMSDFKDFPMPSFMNLNGEGLLVIYQQYEVAPYSQGFTMATIPYDKLKELLQLDTKDLKPIEISQ